MIRRVRESKWMPKFELIISEGLHWHKFMSKFAHLQPILGFLCNVFWHEYASKSKSFSQFESFGASTSNWALPKIGEWVVVASCENICIQWGFVWRNRIQWMHFLMKTDARTNESLRNGTKTYRRTWAKTANICITKQSQESGIEAWCFGEVHFRMCSNPEMSSWIDDGWETDVVLVDKTLLESDLERRTAKILNLGSAPFAEGTSFLMEQAKKTQTIYAHTVSSKMTSQICTCPMYGRMLAS